MRESIKKGEREMLPLQVKLINSECLGKGTDFEDEINNFCETIATNGYEVIDIKYQMTYTPPEPYANCGSEQVHTALIMYR
jgi:hypothetical protein